LLLQRLNAIRSQAKCSQPQPVTSQQGSDVSACLPTEVLLLVHGNSQQRALES
jgi:hypothetical protein